MSSRSFRYWNALHSGIFWGRRRDDDNSDDVDGGDDDIMRIRRTLIDGDSTEDDTIHHDEYEDEDSDFYRILNEVDITLQPNCDYSDGCDYEEMSSRFESFIGGSVAALSSSSAASASASVSVTSPASRYGGCTGSSSMSAFGTPPSVSATSASAVETRDNMEMETTTVSSNLLDIDEKIDDMMEAALLQDSPLALVSQSSSVSSSSSQPQRRSRRKAAEGTKRVTVSVVSKIKNSKPFTSKTGGSTNKSGIENSECDNETTTVMDMESNCGQKFQISWEAEPADDDGIVITDEDEDGAGAGEEDTRDDGKLFEYPPGKDSVIVTVKDYMTLEHETWLNDNVIDFYLSFLFLEVLPAELRSSVHLFTSMFYNRMLGVGLKNKTNQREEARMTSAQRKHSRVKTWTKNVNLFEKEFVIFPICEGSHWFLIVAILPRLATLAPDSAARRDGGEPLVLVLDSLGGTKSGAVANIRSYLALEWAARGGGGNHAFDSKEMRTLRPRKPEQQNGNDCGIYLLYYVEKMFTR